jgi:hypothetical protein
MGCVAPGGGKCAKGVLKREKLVHSQNLVFEFYREIQQLEQGKNMQISRD